MSGDLRTALLIISSIIIVGLLVHGIWTMRKSNKEKSGATDLDKVPLAKINSQDADVRNQRAEAVLLNKDTYVPLGDDLSFSATRDDAPASNDEPAVTDAPETTESDSSGNTESAGDTEESIEAEEVLILHVVMPEGQSMAGAMLLPQLITLGFKFGEMDIFHRHQNNDGTGPVLFRLSNMYNPGTFDIDNIEAMNVRGISLFMTLPCHDDPINNFNMMHNAAKKLSVEFGAKLLDAERNPMTAQSSLYYVEKIREFSRKKLVENNSTAQ